MNKERILKYLSDLMDQSEREQFERDLKNDVDFKSDFEKVTSNLSGLKNLSNVEADERYFANLTVKIKKEKSRENRKFRIPALTFGAIAAMLLAFFITSDLLQKNENELNLLAGYEDVIYEIFSDANSEVTSEFGDFEIFASNDLLLDRVELNDEITDILPDVNGNGTSDFYNYDQMKYQLLELDQQDLDNVIQELNEKNIL